MYLYIEMKYMTNLKDRRWNHVATTILCNWKKIVPGSIDNDKMSIAIGGEVKLQSTLWKIEMITKL